MNEPPVIVHVKLRHVAGDVERGRPLYLAWRILDDPSSQCFDAIKARDYFRTPIPEAFADKLAHRAEAVFAK